MTDKALISEYTYRSLESQRANSGDMPVFILPDDLSQIFRETTRKIVDRYHVDSLAVIAKKEDEFRDFLSNAKKRKAEIVSREDNQTFVVNGNCENIVKWWKDARRKGAGAIGGQISADNKKEFARRGIELIRADWPKPSNEVSTEVLKARSGLSLNTIKKYLGPRPIAQYNNKVKHQKQIKDILLNPEPREETDFCGVYVFQIEKDIYKIGHSLNAKNRLKHVSAYQKKSMKVVALYNMDIEKARALEIAVHNRLARYRAHEYNGREIFKITLTTIKRAIKQTQKELFEVHNEE